MKNILFSGNEKVFDGMLTGMLSILMRTESTEPFCFFIFTMDVSHLRADYRPVSGQQARYLEEVAKTYKSKKPGAAH